MELGQLLHQKLFGSLLPVDEEMFVSSMAVLERLSARRGDHHEAENFYFSVFSEGKEAIDRQCESTGCIVVNNRSLLSTASTHQGCTVKPANITSCLQTSHVHCHLPRYQASHLIQMHGYGTTYLS